MIELVLGILMIYVFFTIIILIAFGDNVLIAIIDRRYELKKLKIQNQSKEHNEIEIEHKDKLKYLAKTWLITITAILIICIIVKLFGFNMSDIAELF